MVNGFFGPLWDLTPLTKAVGDEWAVSVTSGADTYKYLINVCGNTSHCTGSGVCQTKPSDGSFAKSLGLSSTVNLDIVDMDALVLSYTQGDACHTGVQRTSAINFHCDLYAGAGQPSFDLESGNCSYVFHWSTIHACVPQV